MTSQLFSSSAKNLLNTKVRKPQGDEKVQVALVQPIVRNNELQGKLMDYVNREFDYYIRIHTLMDVPEIGLPTSRMDCAWIIQSFTDINLLDDAKLHLIVGTHIAEEMETVTEDTTDIGTNFVWESTEELEDFLEEVSDD